MIEYSHHIDFYKEYAHSSFSNAIPADNWGNKELASQYLKNYWLPEEEYKTYWKEVQNKIFINQEKGLPELLFSPSYEILALRGGCVFLQEDFERLQKAILNVGDSYFVVIQNTQNFTPGEPMFRMKFPANISWKELMGGNYISAVLFEMPYNEYFVFGESGNWGKYSANDYTHPLDIIGFKPELTHIFDERLKQQKEEQEELWEWLPQAYKKLIKY